MDDDFEACLITREDTERDLAAIERRLAQKFGIETNVREELLARDRAGQLPHCPEVADWQQTYASYLDWLTV